MRKNRYVQKLDFFGVFYQDYPMIFSETLKQGEWYWKNHISRFSAQNQSLNYLEEIGLLNELKEIEIYQTQSKNTKKHEYLNIEIAVNKIKFINYFENIIQEKSKCKEKKLNLKESICDFEIEDSKSTQKNLQEVFFVENKETNQVNKIINNIDL